MLELGKIYKKPIFWWLLYIIIFILVLYFSRSYYLEKTDLSYLEDYFLNSQWKNFRSTRIMSDNELYQYAGYSYLKGENIFNINPEVPPLGKYFYGISIILFNNVYIIVIPLFILIFLSFHYLSGIILENKTEQRVASLLFLINPIFINQLQMTMLELPQLLSLLLHFISIFKIKKDTKKITWPVLAGFFLGCFSASKFPVYLIFILLFDFIYFIKIKKLIFMIIQIFFTSLTYVLFFYPYFLQGHSFYEWIKSELWTINFYRAGRINENIVSKLIGILTGYIKYSWIKQNSFQRIFEWNILWPIGIFALFLSIFKFKINFKLKYLIYFGIMIFLSFLFLSFNGRYFILLMPILILVSTKLLINYRKFFIFTLVIIFFQTILFLNPSPIYNSNYISDCWSKGNYKEIFNLLSKDSRQNYSFEKFNNRLNEYYKMNNLVNIKTEIILNKGYFWKREVRGVLKIYNNFNNLSIFESPVNFVRENNKWKLIWEDKFLP